MGHPDRPHRHKGCPRHLSRGERCASPCPPPPPPAASLEAWKAARAASALLIPTMRAPSGFRMRTGVGGVEGCGGDSIGSGNVCATVASETGESSEGGAGGGSVENGDRTSASSARYLGSIHPSQVHTHSHTLTHTHTNMYLYLMYIYLASTSPYLIPSHHPRIDENENQPWFRLALIKKLEGHRTISHRSRVDESGHIAPKIRRLSTREEETLLVDKRRLGRGG